jgi:hypothetical protein
MVSKLKRIVEKNDIKWTLQVHRKVQKCSWTLRNIFKTMNYLEWTYFFGNFWGIRETE